MKLVIQRVNQASVRVKGSEHFAGKIGKGLFVLLGVGESDDYEIAEKLAEQLSKLRILADSEDKMNLSVLDIDGEVMVVSQFTLYGDTSKGNRPSFIKAGDPAKAEEIYEYFVNKLKQLGVKTQTGSFGKYMIIEAELDGPTTILISEDK